jgi:large subunit ribosomal protein L25
MALPNGRRKETMAIARSTLEGKPREQSGKGYSRRLRASGRIPAVVYGRHSKGATHFSVEPASIKTAVSTPHRFNTLITLKIDGQPDREVLVRDFQLDPVSRDLLHADFLEVREDEKVKVKVPLRLVGRPAGVAEGGILSQLRRELELYALPSAIPEKIEVDVSHLKMAQSIHVNDIKFPAGVEVKTTINYTLAVVAVPEKEEVVAPPPTAEAVVAEEGAAAPAGAEAKPGAGAPVKPGAGAPAKPGAPAGPEAKPAAAAPAGKKEESKKEDKKK